MKVEPQSPRKPTKLARLPANARIEKRPLLHAPIPSPYASAASQKVIYISSKTPFISAVKRVRKLLKQAETRATQSKIDKHGTTAQRIEAATKAALEGRGSSEEVVVKATGKCIEKALNLALFFQGQGDCDVRIRTGTVAAIDDIVLEPAMERSSPATDASQHGGTDIDAAEVPRWGVKKEVDEVPETRIRHTSVIEVAVSLR
ncbi:hypothetical protein H2201_006688 [Coniosporium apollinis]|uniref:Uncharacterized protein n=2 Tax=Coniosporium TaxID=2810619 RepID=A0ABQ9NLB5_9PEZI|nr:hypothetical protein H2199_005401 [Cladosporium sp. JES 115]KAJ9660960.1 hypothetical protein H2201_006688 [Coniosporium apollinis]